MKEIEKPVFEGIVLVCEDNSMNLMLISEQLKQAGLSVIKAQNRNEGVEKVKKRAQISDEKTHEDSNSKTIKQFDLIFMDIHMPVMDGIEAAEIIHRIDSSIPIIAMTTDRSFENIEKFRDNGIVDYLSKPFKKNELWRCLIRHLTPVN